MPPGLLTTETMGRAERHNGFWGMIGPGFIYIAKYNLVLVNAEAINAARIMDGG